ncbi:MAG: pyridoxal-phosphate dependent enzyme [Desulfurococcales archaeon]|nr:pyridoxal-phosphate dependent enzyme [Desulfurococcales archaeon]
MPRKRKKSKKGKAKLPIWTKVYRKRKKKDYRYVLNTEILRLIGILYQKRKPVPMIKAAEDKLLAIEVLRILGVPERFLEDVVLMNLDVLKIIKPPYKMGVAKNPAELVEASKPTPLVRLKIKDMPTIWAKLEWFNPFSLSVKDRIAAGILLALLEIMDEVKGVTEVSSGNTGIAIASLVRALGLDARIYFPGYTPEVTRATLDLLGVEYKISEKGLTVDLIDDVKLWAKWTGFTHVDQFENDYNFLTHLRTTTIEIIEQLEKAKAKPDKIVLVSGTSGTSAAVSFGLYHYYKGRPDIYIVQPAKDEVIEGIRRLETGAKWLEMIREAGLEYNVIDVKRQDALCAVREIARNTGLLPGPSSGAAYAGIKQLVEQGEIERKHTVITLFPDHGLRYIDRLIQAKCSDNSSEANGSQA